METYKVRVKPSGQDCVADRLAADRQPEEHNGGVSTQPVAIPTGSGAAQTFHGVPDRHAAHLALGTIHSKPDARDRWATCTDAIFVKPEEARRLIGVRKTKYHGLCNEGRLVRVYEGRMVRVTMASIRAYAEDVLRRSLEAATAEAKPIRKRGAVQASKTKSQQRAAAEPIVAPAVEPIVALTADSAEPGSPLAEPAAHTTNFDDSWLTLAGVSSEQL